MELLELRQLTTEDRSQLEGDEQDPYETDALGLSWRGKDIYLAVRSAGQLVAAAGLVTAHVCVEGRGMFEVIGLGDVIVERSHRGAGYGRLVIENALGRAGKSGAQFAMLFCDGTDARLYRKFDFREIRNAVTVDQPAGRLRMPLMAMWRGLTAGASWPEGEVKLVGLPF